MSEYPPPGSPLPYATPQARPASRRPTSVTVIAVIGIIFGSLGLLGGLCSLPQYMGFGSTGNPVTDSVQRDPFLRWFMIVTLVLGIVMGIVLLWGSIGALSLKPAARKALIGYAIAYLIVSVIGIIVNLAVVLPRMDAAMRSSNAPVNQTMQNAWKYGAYGGLCVSIVVILWPVLMLYYLNRPHVRAAFGDTSAAAALPPLSM